MYYLAQNKFDYITVILTRSEQGTGLFLLERVLSIGRTADQCIPTLVLLAVVEQTGIKPAYLIMLDYCFGYFALSAQLT
uniref:MFS transporter n=1 Tax=Heterorhabditis bacteriophora TaxID=37862 RepID=A0A1I7XCP1_HETBA